MEKQRQTSLIERLESIPRDAVLVIEHDQFSASFRAVGRLCHEAAAALDRHDRYKSRASTHADDCWSWGHGHYECALMEIELLVAEWRRVSAAKSEAEARAEQLAEALKKVAQSLEWYAHGRCRGFDDEAPLPTNEAVELAERTLAKVRA